MTPPAPITTLFIGIQGFIALALSYTVVMERSRVRVANHYLHPLEFLLEYFG